MKKLLTIILTFFCIYANCQNSEVNTLTIRDSVQFYKNSEFNTIIVEDKDSLNQFLFRNAANPIDDLDVVNLRTLSDSLADISGYMKKSIYDPQTIESDAFDRANHTGTQGQITIDTDNTDNTLTGTNQKENDDQLDSKAIVNSNQIAINQQAIADLSPASGRIINSTTPTFAPIPLIQTLIPFTVEIQSNDTTILEFYDIGDTIAFKKDVRYEFFGSFSVSNPNPNPSDISLTTRIIDVSDNSIVFERTRNIILSGDGTDEYSFGVTITPDEGLYPPAPFTVRLETFAVVNSGQNINFETFNIRVASQSGAGGEGVTLFDDLADTPIDKIGNDKKMLFVDEGGNTIGYASDLFWDEVNSNLGIGTATPQEKLDISGRIAISGEQTVYNAHSEDGFVGSLFIGNGGDGLVHNSFDDGYYNTGVGINALRKNTDGYQNTALGAYVLDSNTTGGFNTAIGSYAMYENNTGDDNTAVGVIALSSNTIGGGNTAIGVFAMIENIDGNLNTAAGADALIENTSGSENTCIGAASLANNFTGSYNVAIGHRSGQNYGGGNGVNTNGSNNIFIGKETDPLLDGDTNEIVIGNGAIGNGSNTTTIGNSSVTWTLIEGILNIASTPTYADDAAAGLGGLVAGDVYSTPTGELRKKL